MKYTVWFCAIEVEEENPQRAAWQAMKEARGKGGLMLDRVVDSEGIIRIATDPREVGKNMEEGHQVNEGPGATEE